ncbi:MAG: AAA family ATPase [Rubripirellula sp.]
MESFHSNPFCTRFVRPGTLDYQFSLATASLPAAEQTENLEQLAAQIQKHQIALIVGPHGTGKTTLLHSLGSVLDNLFTNVSSVQLLLPLRQGFFARLEHSRRIARAVNLQQASLPDRGLLIIDGAEQLSSFNISSIRRRAKRHGQFVLATSHEPLRGFHVIHQTEMDQAIVQQLTEQLLSDMPSGISDVVREQLRQRDWTKLSNVRDLWFELYDLVQPHFQDTPS